MTVANAEDFSPRALYVAAAAEAAMAAMPADLVAECELLVSLDPSLRGVRCIAEPESLVLLYAGRVLARIPWADLDSIPAQGRS